MPRMTCSSRHSPRPRPLHLGIFSGHLPAAPVAASWSPKLLSWAIIFEGAVASKQACEAD